MITVALLAVGYLLIGFLLSPVFAWLDEWDGRVVRGIDDFATPDIIRGAFALVWPFVIIVMVVCPAIGRLSRRVFSSREGG